MELCWTVGEVAADGSTCGSLLHDVIDNVANNPIIATSPRLYCFIIIVKLI